MEIFSRMDMFCNNFTNRFHKSTVVFWKSWKFVTLFQKYQSTYMFSWSSALNSPFCQLTFHFKPISVIFGIIDIFIQPILIGFFVGVTNSDSIITAATQTWDIVLVDTFTNSIRFTITLRVGCRCWSSIWLRSKNYIDIFTSGLNNFHVVFIDSTKALCFVKSINCIVYSYQSVWGLLPDIQHFVFDVEPTNYLLFLPKDITIDAFSYYSSLLETFFVVVFYQETFTFSSLLALFWHSLIEYSNQLKNWDC